MHEVQVPLELKPVFNKRGSDWTPKEKDQVLNWLYKHQQTYLLILALRYLRRYNTRGGYATPEDAEDAFQDLFAKKWEGILRNYDPAKGDNDRQEERYCRFWTYLKTCLKRVCIDLKIGEPFPIGYDLRLMSVAAADGLVNKGRNLVIVALVGTDLHIRIFDASGKKVVDKAENELVSGETLTALKKQLNPIPDESGLSKEHKQKIIGDATSIAGHARTIVTRYEHEVPLLKPEDDEGEPTVYEVVGKDDPGKPIAEEEGEFVKECLRRVKKTSREVIEMHYVRDMCHEENRGGARHFYWVCETQTPQGATGASYVDDKILTKIGTEVSGDRRDVHEKYTPQKDRGGARHF